MRTFVPREAQFATVAAVLSILLSALSILPASSGAAGPPSRSLSNSGVILIEDAASTVIYGREVYPQGDVIGSYVWSGDINGDGVDDIGFSSTVDGENRGVNFIHGQKGSLPEFIDLSAPGSVSFSVNYPARQIEMGDADHDGIKDLMLAAQLVGRYYRGTSSGFDIANPGVLKSGIKQETWEYPYNDFMWAGDIDGDSLDDLVLGTFGCGGFLAAGIYQPDELNIYWSSSGNRTRLTADKWDDFTTSLDVGDIDGDGRLDMIVGVPRGDPDPDQSRQYGAVCIYFNITRFDNVSLANPYLAADSMIYGSDQYDQFGWNVMLRDINGDGRDDILAGAPNSGGIQNLKPDCGEIMIFHGKDNRSFPDLLDAENDADVIIIGATGSSSDPEYIGDKIGRTYQLSDMDGNGYLEILISTPFRLLSPLDSIPRESAGSLSMYELDKIIPKAGKIVTLSYPSKSFTLEGRDWGDTLGWQVRVGDVNGDHFDDLLVGVPAADGYNNIRRNCGELYIINGEGTRLKDHRISGPGSSPPKIFTMGGAVDINLSFESTNGYRHVKGGRLTLGSGADAVSLVFDGGTFRKERDRYDSVLLDREGCSFGGSGRNGWLNFRMELRWHFPFEGRIDLRFELTDIEDVNVTRFYPSSAVICKDVRLTDNVKVFSDGGELMTRGSYLPPGTGATIQGSAAVYRDDPLRTVPYGTLWINHFEGLFYSDDVVYSKDWSVDLTTPGEGEQDHSLAPWVDPGTYPESLPSKYLPDMGAPVVYRVRVDGSAPFSPTGLKAFSMEGNPGNISQTGEFLLTWDDRSFIDGDRGLSGIREYWVSVDEGVPVLSLESGGLVGTYYSDLDSYRREKEVVDERLHFTVNDWGPFGPDPNLMLPYDYSVRWWGWLDMGKATNQFFKLVGSGDARMFLGGERLIDWTPIDKGIVIGGLDFTEGERPRLEIVLRHGAGDSYFSFLYQDDTGGFSPVPSEYLLHPSNSRSVRIRSSQGTARVTAVDWVGLSSEPAELSLFRDDTGPAFDVSGVPRWVNTPAPRFDVAVWDANEGSSPVSGLDPATIMFRTEEENGPLADWMKPLRVKEAENEPGKYIATVELTLDRDWNGEVQLTASDLEGNIGPAIDDGGSRRAPLLRQESLSPSCSPVKQQGNPGL
ncbi:MAG: hypothetical protein ACMUHU_05080, partial [Thermoplasmatota archaeon]